MNETALIPATPALPVIPVSDAEHDRLSELWNKRKAAATYRAYGNDWRGFKIFAFSIHATTLPATPDVVARYLAHLQASGRATATIGRHVASISHFHRESNLSDPTKHPMVAGILEGIRRSNAGKPTNAKAAVLTKHLRKGLKAEPTKPREIRNRALVLLGYAGAFRRSELVAIDVEHLTWTEQGVRVALLRSKTNQHGEMESVHITAGGVLCPVRALREWMATGRIESGPVFRHIDRHGNLRQRLSGDAVGYQVKAFVRKAGLDPKLYGGHSLRAGHVTQALLNDTPAHLVQRQGRWRSIETVMRYNREVDSAKHNSSSHLGL